MKDHKIVDIPGEIRFRNFPNMNKSILLCHVCPARQFPSSHIWSNACSLQITSLCVFDTQQVPYRVHKYGIITPYNKFISKAVSFSLHLSRSMVVGRGGRVMQQPRAVECKGLRNKYIQ